MLKFKYFQIKITVMKKECILKKFADIVKQISLKLYEFLPLVTPWEFVILMARSKKSTEAPLSLVAKHSKQVPCYFLMFQNFIGRRYTPTFMIIQ
jgi:hypothetical protein